MNQWLCFDSAGPLRFLRSRWVVGPKWRRMVARFFAGAIGITCQAHSKGNGYAYDGFFVPADVWLDCSYQQKESIVMGWIRKIQRPQVDAGAGNVAVDRDWVHELPALHEYLTVAADADGAPRRTSTLTVFAEHAAFKVFLNDRDTGASLCATGDSVRGALSALEVLLEGDSPPWRFYDRPDTSKGKRRGRSS